MDAPWRQPEQKLTHWGLAQRILSSGQTLSPLLSAPAFRSSCFLLDWLHGVDQGIAADFVGELFWMLLQQRGSVQQPVAEDP